jgi:hypothetical protein
MHTGTIVITKKFAATTEYSALTSFKLIEKSPQGLSIIHCKARGEFADFVNTNAGARVTVGGYPDQDKWINGSGEEVILNVFVINQIRLSPLAAPAASAAAPASPAENKPDLQMVGADVE